MRTLEARIAWKSEEEGCIEQPFSGIQPSILVAGDLIIARVEIRGGAAKMERGKVCDVLIKLPYGEHYSAHLHPGMAVRLQVGERIIAEGIVERVY